MQKSIPYPQNMALHMRGLKHLALFIVVFLVLANAAHACKLAILGDSLTAGYGVPEGQSFPDQLFSVLKASAVDCEVINAGVSGDTSAGGAARLDWVLADKPTHLLVELGANDALRALPVDQLERNLEKIVQKAQQTGVQVMLAGMLAPPNLGETYGDQFALVYESLSKKYDIPLYPFFLQGVAGNPDLNIEDGIHPNVAGIAEITDRIVPIVIDFVRR